MSILIDKNTRVHKKVATEWHQLVGAQSVEEVTPARWRMFTDTDRDRIRAKIEVGLDAVLAAEAANGGKLPEGFGLPPEPAPASDGNAAGDGAAGENAADDGAAEDGAAEDGARAPEAAVDDTPAPSDADTPDAPDAAAGDEPVPPRP